jgi:hypothetical protein
MAHSQVMPGVAFFVSAVAQPNPMDSSTSPILLEIPEIYLCEMLNDLSQKSGIEFNCPDRLQSHIVLPKVIEESNWVSLIRVLLDDYNVIEIWNQNDEMTKVYLVGSKELGATVSQDPGVITIQTEMDNVSAVEGMPGGNLTKSQLFVLLKTSTYRPMPSHMFNSADFKEVLSFAGIESPRDWLDLQKSKVVKEQIQKLLKLKKNKK